MPCNRETRRIPAVLVWFCTLPCVLLSALSLALPLTSAIEIYDAEQQLQARIKPSGELVVYPSGFAIKRKISSSGKVSYKDQTGTVIYTIKSKKDGFKVKSSGGQTLWKLKEKSYGLKIGKGDEMSHAYKLKQPIQNEYRLFHKDEMVSEVTFEGFHIALRGPKVALIIREYDGLALAGVLAIDDAELMLRLVILAELIQTQ